MKTVLLQFMLVSQCCDVSVGVMRHWADASNMFGSVEANKRLGPIWCTLTSYSIANTSKSLEIMGSMWLVM